MTRIDLALKVAAEKVFVPSGGSRSSVPKILILMTDGYQTQIADVSTPLDKEVLPLRRKGVQVYALAIGPYTKERELRLIVQKKENIFKSATFLDLLEIIGDLVTKTCAEALPVAFAIYPLNKQNQGKDISARRAPTGVLSNVPSLPGPYGRPGGSFYLLGTSNSFIDFANGLGGKLDSWTSISIFLWVYSEGQPGPIVNYRRVGQGVGLWLKGPRLLSGSIYSRRNHLYQRSMNYVNLSPKKWYFIGLTYDYTKGMAALWIDGRKVSQTRIGRIYLATNYPIRMGAMTGKNEYFKGRVTCLQIYGTALDASDIPLIKNKCAARDQKDPCLSSPCLNGGSCIFDTQARTGYRCRCKTGYSGLRCEIKPTQPTARPTGRPTTRGSTGSPGRIFSSTPSQLTTPSRSSGAVIPGGSLAGFRIEILEYINRFRRIHGAGPVILSMRISMVAQNWAQSLVARGTASIDPSTSYGTNVFTRVGSLTGLAQIAVVTWYSSVKYYDWAKRKSKILALPFIHMIWLSSNFAGVGLAKSSSSKFYVVVYFDPMPGNKEPLLKDNILPYTDVYILMRGVTCNPGFQKFDGTCYKYHRDKQTWEAALFQSAMVNATLVSFHKSQEEAFVQRLIPTGYQELIWTGLNDRITEGTYTWSDGTSVEYSTWKANEPTGDKEDCVGVQVTNYGTMSDVLCNQLHNYVSRQPLEGLITYRTKFELPSSPWTDDYSEKSSLSYMELKRKIETLLLDIYKNYKTFVSGYVEDFRGKSFVIVSLILKFGPGVPPDPTISIQDFLRKNLGRLPAPVNQKTLIQSVRIVLPGIPPAVMGSCTSSCLTTCFVSCNPFCCTSKIPSSYNNQYSGTRHGVIAQAAPNLLASPYSRSAVSSSPGQGMAPKIRPMAYPVTMTRKCIPHFLKPCPSGSQGISLGPGSLNMPLLAGPSAMFQMQPRRVTSLRKMALPRPPLVMPQYPYQQPFFPRVFSRPMPLPCIPSPFNPCTNPIKSPAAKPTSVIDSPLHVIHLPPAQPLANMMQPPCVPSPYRQCPPTQIRPMKPASVVNSPLHVIHLPQAQPPANMMQSPCLPSLYRQCPPAQMRPMKPLSMVTSPQVIRLPPVQPLANMMQPPCVPSPYRQCPPAQMRPMKPVSVVNSPLHVIHLPPLQPPSTFMQRPCIPSPFNLCPPAKVPNLKPISVVNSPLHVIHLPPAPPAPRFMQPPCIPGAFNSCPPSKAPTAKPISMVDSPLHVIHLPRPRPAPPPPPLPQTSFFPRPQPYLFPRPQIIPVTCIPRPYYPCPPNYGVRKLSKPSHNEGRSRTIMPRPGMNAYQFPSAQPYMRSPVAAYAPFAPQPMFPSPIQQPVQFVPNIYGFGSPFQAYRSPIWPQYIQRPLVMGPKIPLIKPIYGPIKDASGNDKAQTQSKPIPGKGPVTIKGSVLVYPKPAPAKPPPPPVSRVSPPCVPSIMNPCVPFRPYQMASYPFPASYPCIPSLANPCLPVPGKPAVSTTTAKTSPQSKPILLTRPLQVQGNVYMNPHPVPQRTIYPAKLPCIPTATRPCIPLMQPQQPFPQARYFSPGILNPFPSIVPQQPLRNIAPVFTNPIIIKQPIIPKQPSAPTKSLILQLPEISFVPAPASPPIPSNCPISCTVQPGPFCPPYCPAYCCKKKTANKALPKTKTEQNKKPEHKKKKENTKKKENKPNKTTKQETILKVKKPSKG
ncbi:uncharacterized protein [Montipora foliosa]|uniref:uncharacterized protein n=1 Tax=Montipora foliosa TaxID=591990 RepID=UPI0035F15F2C